MWEAWNDEEGAWVGLIGVGESCLELLGPFATEDEALEVLLQKRMVESERN